jgi:hypothetical protein
LAQLSNNAHPKTTTAAEAAVVVFGLNINAQLYL